MKALTLVPGRSDSLAIEERPEPTASGEELLVEAVAVGVCGTDREIASGAYGWSPPGRDRLTLGHESLGRVVHAPEGGRWAPGDLVAGVVRRPDPEPCGACAAGRFDMCRNGRYRERGIKELDGYASERWTVPVDYAVPVDPGLGLCGVLTEPASVVAKAWEQIERIGNRAWFEPRTVLVTGAGPIGLLAALMGAQRDLDVHVLDRVTDGPKPDLVSDLGATYHSGSLDDLVSLRPDIVVEGTGVGRLVLDAVDIAGSYGIVCLTGVSSGGRSLGVDAGEMNREIVLENHAIVGSVNASVEHYEAGARALADADRAWLRRLITRVVPFEQYAEAIEPRDGDVKTVIGFAPAAAIDAPDR